MPSNFTFTMVTHACIKVQARFGALLCDPWLLNEPVFNFTTWKFPAARLSPEEVLDGVTHIYITHSHEDHLHAPSLDLIPRDVTILLPDYTWHPGRRAQTMEKTMRALGFTDVRLVKPWESLHLEPDLTLTVIPAAASKPRDWENSGLMIEHADCRVFNINDCPSDEDLFAQVSERFGKIDLALVQYAGVSSFPGRFRMSEEEMLEAVQNKRTSFAEQERAVTLLDVASIVPIAGDFCWLDDRLYHCNWTSRSTPYLLRDWMVEHYPKSGIEFMPMYPSDVWRPGTGFEHKHPPIDWNNYLDEIARLKKQFQPKIDAINAWLEESDQADLPDRTQAYMSNVEENIDGAEDIDFTIRCRIAIEDGAGQDFSFVLDISPETGFRVLWDDAADTDQTFYIPRAVWASLLEGKVTFSQMSWIGETAQHEDFRDDFSKFWFWLEYYIDLNNRHPQVLIEPGLHPKIAETVRPRLGVFDAVA